MCFIYSIIKRIRAKSRFERRTSKPDARPPSALLNPPMTGLFRANLRFGGFINRRSAFTGTNTEKHILAFMRRRGKVKI